MLVKHKVFTAVKMKCRYQIRWFYSKGAQLVLLWTLLTSIVSTSLFHFILKTAVVFQHPYNWLILILPLLTFLLAPLTGWLADTNFEYYKVLKAGAMLLFVSTVINCFLQTFKVLAVESKEMEVIKGTLLCLSYIFVVIGNCALSDTLLPFGLDQMPDGSTSSITSFIAWFVGSCFIVGIVMSKLWVPAQ